MLSKVNNLNKLKIFVFYLIFLLVAPPVIKVYNHWVFKIEFLLILIWFLFLFYEFFFNKRKLQTISLNFFLFFMVILFYGLLYGIVKGNSFYILIKDVCFLSFPFMFFYLLKNYKEFIDNDFFQALFIYALIVAFIQIVFSVTGFFLHVDRPTYRHIFLLFSNGILPLVLVLRIVFYKRFLVLYNIIIVISMLIVRSRTNLLFIILLLLVYVFSKYFKGVKIRLSLLLLIILGFTFIWVFPLLFPFIKNFFGSSLKWRYQEWESFFVFVSNKHFVNILIGNGFGATLTSLKPLNVFGGAIHLTLERFHNIFLFLIFKLGILGIMAYILFFYLIMKKIAKFINNDIKFYFAFFLVFLIFVDSPVNGGFFMSIFSGLILGFSLFLNFFNIETILLEKEKE